MAGRKLQTTDHITNTSIAMNKGEPKQNVVRSSRTPAQSASAPAPAQRAVPRSVSTSGEGLSSASSPTIPPPDQKMSRSESAKNAIDARWAAEKANEQEVYNHFFNLSTDEGVQLLGKMRFNCEVAARGINAAIEKNKKEDKCYVCEGPKPPNKQWAFIRAVKHPVTHTMYNIFFCSTACVSRENIKNQGMAGANHLR